MNNKILSLLMVLALASCSAPYHQIATIGSAQMKVSEDGRFSYSENDITVDYDFWSKYGKVGFVVTNNTKEDIYIDLSRSFLIVNGMTFDYYQSRIYKADYSKTYFSSSSFTGANTFAHANGWYATHMHPNGKFGYANGGELFYIDSFHSSSDSSSTVKRGFEIAEKKGVWIPAQASRYFCEFSLLEAPYRECGLPRDPSKKESASVDFTEQESPYYFENRIMVVSKGEERHLVNSFYIQNITNMPESKAVSEEQELDCSGKKTGEDVKVYRLRAKNRFYIIYKYKGSNNDRLKKGEVKPSLKRRRITADFFSKDRHFR